MALYDNLKWLGPLPESAWGRKSTRITKEDAHELIEEVLDTLIEVGNGTTDEMLHEAADKLFVVRDCFINQE